MSSVVDICNVALSRVGADGQVSAIEPPDGSVEAGYCARFYPIARRQLLEAHAWTFAKKRAALTEVTNTSEVWAYAYARPVRCVKPLRVLLADDVVSFDTVDAPALLARIGHERDSADFEVEGDVIRTNQPEAVLVYTQDIDDTTKFSPGFEVALGVLLAAHLAGPIIKGMTGARLGAALLQEAIGADGRTGLAGKAAAADANSSAGSASHVPDHIRVRG